MHIHLFKGTRKFISNLQIVFNDNCIAFSEIGLTLICLFSLTNCQNILLSSWFSFRYAFSLYPPLLFNIRSKRSKEKAIGAFPLPPRRFRLRLVTNCPPSSTTIWALSGYCYFLFQSNCFISINSPSRIKRGKHLPDAKNEARPDANPMSNFSSESLAHMPNVTHCHSTVRYAM